ncbi:DinB family protein [Paenibacillus allorhizosphaerae]|uniref:DUF1572 domain-containing protein n=1 Tax=Paenibacillus allorhizosphaerae TaxID=2849866 RepID=A0ABN7TIS8_9BACL|nr:DinB family protein [Paenibacillus allorhizosphaerae]CAG7633814.1 hypothetical protein PAECIP111802_01985 [Paenibacillus allorhizosphaerae]
MELSGKLIESFLWKFRAEKKWTLQAIEQLSEEDILWRPTAASNSIANLVAHIWGTVHQRVEIIFFDVPDTRNREKEFEKGLVMTKEQALDLIGKSFDIIIHVLERMKSKPDTLLDQPYASMEPLTYSALSNQSTVLDVMMQMVNHLPFHTGQIVYIAKMRVGDLQWHN